MELVFDLEADGFREYKISHGRNTPEATQVHCLVTKDLSTGEVVRYRGGSIKDAVPVLLGADRLIGHNILMYDLPVLIRLYHDVPFAQVDLPAVFDTQVAARLLWPDAKNHPFGGNSLGELAKQCGSYKGDYKGQWKAWSQEMEDYCEQDVQASEAIFRWIWPMVRRFPKALKTEHVFATIISKQVELGVGISISGCRDLLQSLSIQRSAVLEKIHDMIPPTIITLKTPAYWSHGKHRAPTKGALQAILKAEGIKGAVPQPGPPRKKKIPFNPGSQMQIAKYFKEKYDWDSPSKTDGGAPQVDEKILRSLSFPEAALIFEYQMCEKRLTQVDDWGARAQLCRTPGVIHPEINTCGAATHRCTHKQPNQTACPKVVKGPDKKPLLGFAGRWGWECRSLWGPIHPESWQFGGDASGLELRMLGNRLAKWDKGEFTKVLLEGDIHTYLMTAGGLLTRDQSKNTIYAFIYGAGPQKLGETIGDHPSLSPEQRASYRGKSRVAIGKRYIAAMERNLPALKSLRDYIQAACKRGYLVLLDGRHAPVRSQHSALNTLLQGDGAVVMKWAMRCFWAKAKDVGVFGVQWGLMLNAHDELQGWADTEARANTLGSLIPAAVKEAGQRLLVSCPLDGSYSVGRNWAETH